MITNIEGQCLFLNIILKSNKLLGNLCLFLRGEYRYRLISDRNSDKDEWGTALLEMALAICRKRISTPSRLILTKTPRSFFLRLVLWTRAILANSASFGRRGHFRPHHFSWICEGPGPLRQPVHGVYILTIHTCHGRWDGSCGAPWYDLVHGNC